MEPYEENASIKNDSQWMSFKKYTEKDTKVAYSWTDKHITNLIQKTFPFNYRGLPNNECTNINPQLAFRNEKCSMYSHINNRKHKTYKNTCIESNIDSGDSMVNNSTGLFKTKSSKEHWEQLLTKATKKKSLKKITSQWKQSYLNVLALNNFLYERNTSLACMSINSGSDKQCFNLDTNGCPLSSDDSDCEQGEETQKTCDPIYSRFGEIRRSFYTSEDGIVFYSKKELDEYKGKMADMKEILHCELGLIKHQHGQLKARRAEEKKLLSQRMNSQDIPDEEATERDALNIENKPNSNKQERKSALLSSFTDAFSFARIQGIFVKNSPSVGRKNHTNTKDNDSSDEDEEMVGTKLLSQNPDALQDNHDEFTRKMTTDGGLKYTSSDKTDQQLSYQNLPPPLSLNSLPNKT